MKHIFISYSKSDREYLDAAKKHLKIYERQKKVSIWDDTQLIPGELWEKAIHRELAKADIMLFLVSTDLINTDFIWDFELPTALQRAAAGTLEVVPIIIRSCLWEGTDFAQFTALPSKGKPVASWDNEDDAWTEVVHRIGQLC